MKTLHKIIIIIVIIFILIGLYFLLRNKQNFLPEIKFSKKLKDRLLKLKDAEKKKLIIKNDDLQEKIDEIQNKKSSGLFNLKSNNRTIEKYDIPDFDENYLRSKVSSSPLGYSYFLPIMNILKPSDFNQVSGYNILKSDTVIENKDSPGEFIKVNTISIDNPAIALPGTLVNKLDAKINKFTSNESIQKEITKTISGNVGGNYGGVSVQASFSYLTNESTKTTKFFESNNLDFTKTTALYGIKQELFIDQASYKTGFLIDLYKLNNLEPKKVRSHYNDILNFIKRYGSHVVHSVTLGKKCSLWDTVTKESQDSKSVLSIRACISVSYGGWTTCVPSENNKEPCGPGKYCAQYEPAEKDKDGTIIVPAKKGTCQPSGGQSPGFSIGGEACAGFTDTDKLEAQKQTSMTQLVLEGGSAESQAAILISKMNNTPVIDNTAVSDFLASSNNYDVPIELGFESIWDIIRKAFITESKESVNNDFPYELTDINPGCKIEIPNITVNNDYIEKIKNDNKDFELKYDTTVIYTELKYKKLLQFGVKYKAIDNYTSFNLINKGEPNYDSNYMSFDITKLIPKIYFRNPEAIGNEDSTIKSLLEEVKLILRVNNDLKDAKLNYINRKDLFKIIDIDNKNNVKIIKKEKYYSIELNFDYEVRSDFTEQQTYISKNELRLQFDNTLDYMSYCDEKSVYTMPKIEAKKCEKSEIDQTNKITYYTFGYYDDELKTNYLRLFVTDNDFSLYFDKVKMNKACDNIEYVYNYEYVDSIPNCSKLEQVTDTINNWGAKSTDTITCSGNNNYITGAQVFYYNNSTHGRVENIVFSCKDGTKKRIGGSDNGTAVTTINSPNGFSAIAWNGFWDEDVPTRNITFQPLNGQVSQDIGVHQGVRNRSEVVSCPPGQVMIEASASTYYGTFGGFSAKCSTRPACDENGCCGFNRVDNAVCEGNAKQGMCTEGKDIDWMKQNCTETCKNYK